MKITPSNKHNRTLNVNEIPTSYVSDPQNLEISIKYTDIGDEGRVHKAVALDNQVIPFILQAVAAYNQLLALNASGKLDKMVELATVSVIENEEAAICDEFSDFINSL